MNQEKENLQCPFCQQKNIDKDKHWHSLKFLEEFIVPVSKIEAIFENARYAEDIEEDIGELIQEYHKNKNKQKEKPHKTKTTIQGFPIPVIKQQEEKEKFDSVNFGSGGIQDV